MTDNEIIEIMARAAAAANLDYDDDGALVSSAYRIDAEAAFCALRSAGLAIVPVECDDDTAEGIWQAAYDEYAEFGSNEKDAGRAAYRTMIATAEGKTE